MATHRFTPRRRTSSTHSDELFEFVDYTSASHFERFSTSVEEVLTAWGVKDGHYGIYSDDQLPKGDPSQTRLPGDFEYWRKEIISIDDNAYVLTYHYHPGGSRSEADDVTLEVYSNYRRFFARDDFLPSTLPGPIMAVPHPTFHPLHRWTGLTRLLILAPANESDIFKPATSVNTVDINTAKLLISACAIAFNNMGCTVPVFIQIGQQWSSLFTGYMLVSSRAVGGVLEDDEVGWAGGDVEVRFKTTVEAFIPTQLSRLQGLTEMFSGRLGIGESNYGSASWSPPGEILTAGVFTYNLKNWFEEDWRRLDDMGSSIINDEESQGTPLAAEDDFLDGYPSSGGLTPKAESQFLTISSLPSLPFGPLDDPLRSLTLSARFPFAPSDEYQDNDVSIEMDALRARHWTLRCEFAPQSQQRAFLAGIIEQAVSSWIRDPSNKEYLAPYDSGNREESPTRLRPDRDLSNLRNLVNAVSQARNTPGGIAMVDTADVEGVLQALFEPSSPLPSKKSNSDIYYHGEQVIQSRHTDVSLLTARALGFHFRHGSVVPYRSLLWNLLLHALNILSSNSKTQNSSSFMGFLKILWTELLRRIRWYWEHLELIPDVGVHTMSLGNAEAEYDDMMDSVATLKPKGSRDIGIDLRFNMLHQKFAMINCCILRQQRARKRYMNNRTTSPSTPSSIKAHTSSPAPSVKGAIKTLFDPLPQLTRNERFDRVTRFFEKFVEGDSEDHPPQSHDYDTAPDIESQMTRSAPPAIPIKDKPHPRPSISETSAHNIPLPEDDDSDGEIYFDSTDDAGVDLSSDFQDHAQDQSKVDNTNQRPSSLSETRTEAFSPSSPSDVSDSQAHSLGDSYIRLNFSTSLEAVAAEPGSDSVQQESQGELPDDDANERELEIKDEDASEGRVRVIKGLTLLQTGEPMWLPEIQNTGFMTEDMLKQQAEVFINLGTSSDAAKIRAKMQSRQLVSDMQAFKAANPHAVIEDFVRWHSPRDWITDVDEEDNPLSTGKLSIRMSEPGNLWQELWKRARRIPASRQKPLFNYGSEGEKALHYLESMSVYEVFSQLLPTISLVAYDTLVSHPVATQTKPVVNGLADLAKELTTYPWDDLREGKIIFDEIISMIRQQELRICNAISLLRKLPRQYRQVERLLDFSETDVRDGEERGVVYELFAGASPGSSFPQPTMREFVLYTEHPRPSPVSRPMPQKMYMLLKDNEFRVVQMTSTDAVYA